MFGLMQYRAAGTRPGENHDYRLRYCGTCKAILHEYGQKARIALNYDVVFLAEVVSQLVHDVNASQQWDQPGIGIACLRDDFKKQTLPFSLSYAAAVNVYLAGVKLMDNVQDERASRKWAWKAGHRFFSADIQKAVQTLGRYGADIPFTEQWLKKQKENEENPLPEKNLTKSLDQYATPTGEITGHFFEAWSKNAEEKQVLKSLGKNYGEMIFILDAYIDLGDDLKDNSFNPLRAFCKNGRLPENTLDKLTKWMAGRKSAVIQAIRQLALPDAGKIELIARLNYNFSERWKEDSIGRSIEREGMIRKAASQAPAKRLKTAGGILLFLPKYRRQRELLTGKASTGKQIAGVLLFMLGILFIIGAIVLWIISKNS